MPAHEQRDLEMCIRAKTLARDATEQSQLATTRQPTAISTSMSTVLAGSRRQRALLGNTGKHIRKLDAALPGKHTRALYNALNRQEAQTLVQTPYGYDTTE